MSHQEDWRSFIAGFDDNQELVPKFHFQARVAQLPAAPTFSYGLPLGEIALYPNHLVFLTLSQDAPGTTILAKEFVRLFVEEYKSKFFLNLWTKAPESLLTELARGLSNEFQQPGRLAEALMSPNSIFIRLNEIREIRFKKGIPVLRPHHMIVTTAQAPLIIFQDPATENMVTTLIGQFTGIWQPEFLQEIQRIALRNASTQ